MRILISRLVTPSPPKTCTGLYEFNLDIAIMLVVRTSARISKVCYSEISHTAIRRQSKSKDHADLLFIIIEGDEEIEADLG